MFTVLSAFVIHELSCNPAINHLSGPRPPISTSSLAWTFPMRSVRSAHVFATWWSGLFPACLLEFCSLPLLPSWIIYPFLPVMSPTLVYLNHCNTDVLYQTSWQSFHRDMCVAESFSVTALQESFLTMCNREVWMSPQNKDSAKGLFCLHRNQKDG